MNRRSKRTGEGPCDGPLSDRQLLRRFVDHDDEEAFAALVARYSGLVLGVCRRTLSDEHAAEDAFQATFLVLARRASRIRNGASLAGWLYAVAYRTALRAGAKRRGRREAPIRDDITVADDLLDQVTERYEQQLVDEELGRLPARYREPLVLRYLVGKSNQEVAAELGLSLGVVEGRLKRGKDRLRLSLVRRGVGLTVALAAVGLSSRAVQAATTDSLAAATAQAAVAFRGGTTPGGNYSQGAMRLAEQELAMSTSAVGVTTWGVAVALVVAGLTLGWAGDTGQQPSQAEEPKIAATAEAASPAALAADDDPTPVELAPTEKEESGSRPQSASALAEKQIEEALGGSATLDFVETPLQDVFEAIAKMHGIKILIDYWALEDIGIAPDMPITLSLSDVPLRSGLDQITDPLDLNWTIHDEVLLVTSPEEAETTLITKVYDVGDLVTRRDKEGDLWADYDTLTELIRTTVAPESWAEEGGPGNIFAGSQMLAVSQTRHVQDLIEQLFEQVRTTAQETVGDKPPTREKPQPVHSPRYGGGIARNPSAVAEMRIEKALAAPAAMEFIDTPLQEVIQTIEDMHEIKLEIDARALEDVGVPLDEPITFNLTGVSLQSGLNNMLRPLHLTWTIQDEVLLITTPEEAETRLLTKVYDVGDLVTCRDKEGELWTDYNSLIEVIATTVEPESWDDVGGPGSIAEAPFAGAEMLAISQTYQIHGQIERLFEQLRAIAQEKGNDEPPTREKPEPRPLNEGIPAQGEGDGGGPRGFF